MYSYSELGWLACIECALHVFPGSLSRQAMKYIFNMKCRLAEMKDKEDSIRRGLNIFKIEQPPSNSIQQMEKVRPCNLANECMYVSKYISKYVQYVLQYCRYMHMYTVDTHTADTHTVDTHTADTHTVDTHTADTHTVDTHTVDTLIIDTHTADTHTADTHTVDTLIIDTHTADTHTADMHTVRRCRDVVLCCVYVRTYRTWPIWSRFGR